MLSKMPEHEIQTLTYRQRIRKIAHNSIFRMVFLYFTLFILSSLILLSFIYWSTVGYIYKQLDYHIEYDMERLQAIYNNEGQQQLINAIEVSLKQKNYDSIYLLYDKNTQQILAGNLKTKPVIDSDGWHVIDLANLSTTPQQQQHSARILLMSLPNNLLFINGLDIESAHQQEHMIFNSLIAGIAIILLLGTIGGFIISISTIKKINLINETINDISEGNLSLRIPSRGSDDGYDLLAENINKMLNQIQGLMQGIQNISNNIAHDLRTPLTRLRSRLEQIQNNCSDETAEGIQDVLAETDNLLATFNAMLRINKVESGAQKGHFTILSVTDIIQDVVDFYEPLAEDKGISIHYQALSKHDISADRDMLFQVFTNLLDNAIKYTPEHGAIDIHINSRQQSATKYLDICIIDTGKGIPKDEHSKVLEPFYRLDKHRDHQGNGLGLSLVYAIIKLHKGSIEFADNKPGLKVLIKLPYK